MVDWETTALEKCPKKTTQYFRFLDDIWGIWDHSEDDFKDFIQTLNNHHKSIKVKYEPKDSSSNFLDTTTYKGPGFPDQRTLDIKVFFKPTDTHALLHKKSHHPSHTFRGIL